MVTLPGARETTSVIRNWRPTCSRPPRSAAPPAEQSRLLRHAWRHQDQLAGVPPASTGPPLSAAPGNCPASSQATRQQALDSTTAKTTASYRHATTGLEHRPTGRPPLDRPGQSARAYGSVSVSSGGSDRNDRHRPVECPDAKSQGLGSPALPRTPWQLVSATQCPHWGRAADAAASGYGPASRQPRWQAVPERTA